MGIFKDTIDYFTKEKEPEVPVVLEPAPCGDDETHYHWKGEGWPCPACHGRAKRRKELEEDERRARLVAKCVAEELRKHNMLD